MFVVGGSPTQIGGLRTLLPWPHPTLITPGHRLSVTAAIGPRTKKIPPSSIGPPSPLAAHPSGSSCALSYSPRSPDYGNQLPNAKSQIAHVTETNIPALFIFALLLLHFLLLLCQEFSPHNNHRAAAEWPQQVGSISLSFMSILLLSVISPPSSDRPDGRR